MTPKPSSYASIRHLLQTGDIVAFGGTQDFVGKAIRFFTRSRYHHVAIVLRTEADRVVLMESSANYGGVRGVGQTFLSQHIADTDGIVDVFTLAPSMRTIFNADKCAAHLLSLQGRPYDMRGAGLSGLGQWLRIPGKQREDALFCSELVDAGHVAGGLIYGRDRTPTPRELVERPIYGAAYRVKPLPVNPAPSVALEAQAA